MAAPHTAGAGLLLRALHPTWTHSQIRSALMLTSQPYLSPKSMDASGAGRVDLSQAANTGFTLHQSTGAMYNYVYYGMGDIRTFNLPSIMDTKCVVNCTWTRTVVSQLAVTATYTTSFELFSGTGFDVAVSPAVFDLGRGKSKTLSFTMDVSALPVGSIGTGMVWFGTTTTGVADMHIPVYTKAAASNLPSKVVENADTPTAGTIDLTVQSISAPALTATVNGLVEGLRSDFSLVEDPTNDDPFDTIAGTQTFTFTIPAGTKRLVAEIVDSSSSDIDMYVGLDDGDGIAKSGEVECMSATGAVLEYCNINNPVAGTYWVLIQNWQASATGATDFVVLTTGVVPTTDGQHGNHRTNQRDHGHTL